MTLGSGFQTFPPPPRPPTLVDEFSGSCWETARRNSPADLKHTQPPSRKQDRPDETRKTVMHLTLQSSRLRTVPRLAPVCPTRLCVSSSVVLPCHVTRGIILSIHFYFVNFAHTSRHTVVSQCTLIVLSQWRPSPYQISEVCFFAGS